MTLVTLQPLKLMDMHLSIFNDAKREAELGMAAVQSELSSCVKVKVAVLGSHP